MANQIYRFFVTFGQKSPFRNSFVEVIVRKEENPIEAENRAKSLIAYALGSEWSMIYPEERFMKEDNGTDRNIAQLFPGGKIGDVIED